MEVRKVVTNEGKYPKGLLTFKLGTRDPIKDAYQLRSSNN
jgi:hypothetical protein